MNGYRCPSCGKSFDPEKNDICPACGTAVAPSVMTRIERKRTAQRMRAEGKFNYDEHCHEDDTWKGSYGAQTHREAVRAHEAELRAGYAAHQAADHPTRVSNANPAAQTPARRKKKSFGDRVQQNLALLFLVFLLPLAFFLVATLLRVFLEWLGGFTGSFSFSFP